MKCENVYAHIFFDRIPGPAEGISDTNIISIDSVSDQAPKSSLRGLYGRLLLNLLEMSAFQSGKLPLGLMSVAITSESIQA